MATDKITHALAGFVLAALFYRCGWYTAIGVAVVVGAAKELYDRKHPPHVASWMDFLATCVGGALGLLNGLAG